MAEHKARRGSRAVRRGAGGAVGEVSKRSRSAAKGASNGAGDAASGALDLVGDVGEEAQERVGGEGGGGGEKRTVSGELRDIVREAALEVFVPVARRATTQAAKYAIRRGPEMARDAADRLGPAVEEAGGPGEFARNALSSVSGKRSGMLEKVGIGRGRGEESGEDSQSKSWRDRRPPTEESVDVAAPIETAYERFGEFLEVSSFLSGGDPVDQRENERITWESGDETDATAVITFHRLGDRLTRVMVTYDFEPEGLVAKATSMFGRSRRGLSADLMRFKGFVEIGDEDAEEPDEQQREQPEGDDDELEAAEDEEPEAEAEAEYEYEDEDDEEEEPEPEPPRKRPARRRAAARPRQQKTGRR